MATFEIIKGTKPTPRGPYQKSNLPAVQRRLSKFMQGKLTAKWLEEWFDKLQPKDQAYFIKEMASYIFVRPKDPVELLTPKQVDELYERITKRNVHAS